MSWGYHHTVVRQAQLLCVATLLESRFAKMQRGCSAADGALVGF
jgi:hypothetical protein